MASHPIWLDSELSLIRDNIHLHVDEMIKLLPSRSRRGLIKKLKHLGLFDAETHTIVRSKIGDTYYSWTLLEFETRIKSGGKKIRYAKVRCSCSKQTEKWTAVGTWRSGGPKNCGCVVSEETKLKISASRRKNDIAIGQMFGRWTVIEKPYYKKFGHANQQFALCRCQCGNTRDVKTAVLRAGKSKSCGCLTAENSSKRRKTHGKSRTPMYNRWKNMCDRCSRQDNIAYNNYGGRGVTVCDEWRNSFEAFEEWALSNGYEQHLEIDRINTNGNYEPSNCRFITCQENCNNKRTCRYYELNGIVKSMKDWSRDAMCAVSYQTLTNRLNSGWQLLEAMTTPQETRKLQTTSQGS